LYIIEVIFAAVAATTETSPSFLYPFPRARSLRLYGFYLGFFLRFLFVPIAHSSFALIKKDNHSGYPNSSDISFFNIFDLIFVFILLCKFKRLFKNLLRSLLVAQIGHGGWANE